MRRWRPTARSTPRCTARLRANTLLRRGTTTSVASASQTQPAASNQIKRLARSPTCRPSMSTSASVSASPRSAARSARSSSSDASFGTSLSAGSGAKQTHRQVSEPKEVVDTQLPRHGAQGSACRRVADLPAARAPARPCSCASSQLVTCPASSVLLPSTVITTSSSCPAHSVASLQTCPVRAG
jgi:hypothetical protein